MLTLTVHVDGLDDLERDWADACRAMSDGARAGVAKACQEGAGEAWERAPDKSGYLRGHISQAVTVTTHGGAAGEIRATAGYSSFVEGGTRPHDIKGSPLAFPGQGGETVFARTVHHPGTKAQPFMGPALQKAERVLVREAEIAVEKAVEIMRR